MLAVSRKEAQASGSSQFFSGKPCPKGHISARYTSNSRCITCAAETVVARQSTAEGRECHRRSQKQNYDRNPQLHIDRQRDFRATPKGQAVRARVHGPANTRYRRSEKGRATLRAWHKFKYDHDPVYKLKVLLRARFWVALKRGAKQGSAVRDLGLSISAFMSYCESHPNWQPDWTWAGLGTVFQLDHIKPLGLFDLTDVQQLRQAVHYTNIQPLSVADHKVKTATDVQMIQARAQVQSLSL